jgi:spermidine/putrescine transport system substrate-binding protein
LAAVGVGIAVAPLVPRVARAAEQPLYFTWAGYDIPELFPAYVKKYGAPPNFAVYGDAEEGLQRLRGGFIVDFAHPSSTDVPRWRDAGFLQPIDVARLSNWPDLFPALKELEGTQADGQQWFVPFDWGHTSITYRTDLLGIEPSEESWGILWDERWKNRIGVLDSATEAWWAAAVYAGIDTSHIGEEEHAKVLDLLRQQRPLVRSYTADTSSFEQGLTNGEMVAAMTWNSSARRLIAEGLPVRFADPKEGRLGWSTGLVLHKQAPNLDRAYEAIDAMLAPETGVYILKEVGFGHSNRKTFEEFSAEELEKIGQPADPMQALERSLFIAPQSAAFEERINREFAKVTAGF